MNYCTKTQTLKFGPDYTNRDKTIIRFLILDALPDVSETIVQIEEHFESLFKRKIARDLVISEIKSFLKKGFIKIDYPEDAENLEKDEIEYYWFELTKLGRQKWEKMSMPPEIQRLLDQGI